jgi:thymidine phosphorylase
MVVAKVGDQVRAGDPVLELHYRDATKLDRANSLAGEALAIADAPPPPARVIVGEVH